MKKLFLALVGVILAIILCACDVPNLKTLMVKDELGTQLSGAVKIVLTNNKENALKITVADANEIKQIASMIGRRKQVTNMPGVDPDYTIVFYLPGGAQGKFYYWMGASENNKNVNFSDEHGAYYTISENMDVFIMNNTNMVNRPENFTELYSLMLSNCISQLPKDKNSHTTVGVDITSDRRLWRYTMSYEAGRILPRINESGYIVQAYVKGGKYTYTVSYMTSLYKPEKASITVDAFKTSDSTMHTFNLNYILSGGKWQVDKTKK